MTNNTEFGRRRPAVNSSEPAARPPKSSDGDESRMDLAEFLFSPLMGQLAGIVAGVLIVFALVGGYVSTMKSAGSALDDQWAKKAIGPANPVNPAEPDFGRMDVCQTRSLNSKFREVQRELGC